MLPFFHLAQNLIIAVIVGVRVRENISMRGTLLEARALRIGSAALRHKA